MSDINEEYLRKHFPECMDNDKNKVDHYAVDKLLWTASVEDIKSGYRFDFLKNKYVCLFCGKEYERGIVFPFEDLLFEAERAVQNHIKIIHGNVFECLVGLNKKFNDISEVQKDLLKLFYKGLSDKEIVEQQGGGSTSTIRSHRYKLKEREKQAKVFLAIMSLLEANDSSGKSMQGILDILSQSEIDSLINAYLRNNR